MWEWALIAGIVIVGLVVWQVARGSGGARASRDGVAGTTFYATDSYSTSASYVGTDTGNECSTDSSDGGSGCDGGGSDGGGGGD